MRASVLAICAIAAALLSPAMQAATAGEYTVYSCRADDGARNNSWWASASSAHVTAYPDGCGADGGGLVARAGVEASGSIASAFDAATWRFDAPAGASISQVALSGRLYRTAGGRWGVGLSDQASVYHLGGISSDAMAWESGGYATVPTPGSTSLYFGVICANGTGCPTTSSGQSAWGYSRARADLFGVRVQVSDGAAPSIYGVRGSLATGTWVSGPTTVGFNASDAVGIAGQSYSVGSLSRNDSKSCDYTVSVPCPAATGSDFDVDSRSLPDGPQALNLTATDTAGNSGSWAGTVYIDNNAPGPPSQPLLQGAPASSWRPLNGFVLTYENPGRGGGAPRTSHDTQVCPADASGSVDPSLCTFQNRSGAPGTDTIAVAGPGRYRLRVRVNDSLFAGAWSPWSDVLRFDNTPPGAPSAPFPTAWVGARAAGGGLSLSMAAARIPVSGITRYLVTGLAGGDISLEASGAATATLPYRSLPEGPSTLSVRAVSGSGLLTEPTSAVTGTVRKDTLPPSLAVSGAPTPGATVSREVTISARATDSISGMAPAPDDRPTTDGGYITFAAPGGALTRFRGDGGSLSPGDGAKQFTISATDLAGNDSAPADVRYTQDTRVPTGGLIPPPSEAPSLIRFLVNESCAGTTAISISASPGDWEDLPMALSDGVASSRVPARIWNGESPYTLRADVTDCAGNHATLDRWAAGPLAGQPIGELRAPARTPTTAHIQVSRSARGARASSSTRLVSGQVKSPDGRPLAGVRVLFEAQPRATGQPWTAVGSEETSTSGKVSRRVPNRHSQLLRISIPETDLFKGSSSNVLRTSVSAATSITARPSRLRNGRRVTIAGRLRGGYVPPRFEITLYGLAPGARSWVPVRAGVAVSKGGSWKASYRFTKTTRSSRYRFRVRIPARPDYPFAAAFSATRIVTVAP